VAHDLFRFRHSTGPASLSDSEWTFGGLQNLITDRSRLVDVASGLRVCPHSVVHRWDKENLRLRGKEAGSEQIVGKTVRGATDKISSRWSDNDDLCLAGEPDVIERVARTKDLGVHRPTSNCLERDRSNELARAASHYHIDFSSCLRKQTRQPH